MCKLYFVSKAFSLEVSFLDIINPEVMSTQSAHHSFIVHF